MGNGKSTAAFHEMKLAISKCTTMHFMSDTAPITLHTDASDYGVKCILMIALSLAILISNLYLDLNYSSNVLENTIFT